MTPQVWGMTPQVSHIKTTRAIICVSVGCRCGRAVLQETKRNSELHSVLTWPVHISDNLRPPSIECGLPLHCLQLCRFKRD